MQFDRMSDTNSHTAVVTKGKTNSSKEGVNQILVFLELE